MASSRSSPTGGTTIGTVHGRTRTAPRPAPRPGAAAPSSGDPAGREPTLGSCSTAVPGAPSIGGGTANGCGTARRRLVRRPAGPEGVPSAQQATSPPTVTSPCTTITVRPYPPAEDLDSTCRPPHCPP